MKGFWLAAGGTIGLALKGFGLALKAGAGAIGLALKGLAGGALDNKNRQQNSKTKKR